MKVLWVSLVLFLCCFSYQSNSQLLEEGSTTTTEIESQGGVEEVTETTVTIEHKHTGDVLDGETGVVTSRYEGDADSDWGGAGSIYSHSACTDSASGFPATGTDGRTSACGHARSNSLTTWRQYIQLNSFGIEEGGEVNYEFLFAFPDSMYQNAGQTAYVQTKGYNDNVLQWDSGQIVIDKTTFTQNPYNYNGNTNWVNNVTGSYDFANALDKVYLEIGGYGEYYWDEFQYNVAYNQITTVIETYLQVVQQEEILNTTINMLDDYEVVEVFTPEIELPEIQLEFDVVENDMSFDEPIVMEEIESFDAMTEEIVPNIEIEENLSPINEDTEPVEEVEVSEVATEPGATDEPSSPANKEIEENATQEEVEEVAEEKTVAVKVDTSKKVAEKKQEKAKKILNNFESSYDNVAQMTTLAIVNALGPEIKTYEEIQIQNVSPSWYEAEEIYSDVIMQDPLGNYFGVRDSLTFNNMVDMQYE